MRIDRNINYFENSDPPYQIAVRRNHTVLHESFDSLEEAIAARDEVEQTYNLTKELNHSSRHKDHLKLSAIERFGTKNLVKIQSEDCQHYRYAVLAECDRCGYESKYISVESYQAFLDRGNLCRSCRLKDLSIGIAAHLHNREEPYSTNRTTDIKNISFLKSKRAYLLDIVRHGSRYHELFKDLNDAINRKSEVLEYYSLYKRLPNKDEI